jgi:uncharacterized protein (TIGR03437 family)
MNRDKSFPHEDRQVFQAFIVALAATLIGSVTALGQAPRRPLNLGELRLPDGFEISIYARGLGAARGLAFSPTGVLFVADINGRVWAVPSADQVQNFATGLRQPHGLTFRGNDLFVAENHRVVIYRNATQPPLTAGPPEFFAELPSSGGHFTRTPLWLPDGRLLVTAGSTCNICNEADQRRAAAMLFNADGSGMQILARGLRNSVGLALHPVTGEVWATDNGGDHLGDDLPPEEINILRFGADYGWPRCYGDGGRYPGFSGDCSGTVPPEVNMQAHSAPLGITFYTGATFPAQYRDDAFVAFHGSWNRSVPTGYKVVRVIASSGRAEGVEDFLTGFLQAGTTSGRPVDVVTGPDGALYVSDDRNGVVYRIGRIGGAAPSINPGGLVSAAAPEVGLSPGSLASLYGVNLSTQAQRASSLPLPLNLDDVRVTVNGVPVPLLFAGPQQINFQVPFGLEGPLEVAVNNSRGTDIIPGNAGRVAPAIFTVDQSGSGLGAIRQVGSILEIYCTGLGDVNPTVAAGAAAPRSPLAGAVNQVAVTIDGQPAQVFFAGLAPDFAGLYQVNAAIPGSARRGQRVIVVLTAGGVASNRVEVVLN